MPAKTARESESAALAAAGQDPEAKRAYVRRMFSDIAPRYDLLNRVLSFNVDRRWRRAAIRELWWERSPSGLYVDLCAGTLDVAAMLASQRGFTGSVVAADFAEPMLRAGRAKVKGRAISPIVSDAVQLPLPDRSAAGAIVAFGLRNVADLDAGLAEARRILTPGSRFVILEFTTPRSRIVRGGYHLYFHSVLPRLGGLISGHPTAYRYLPESVSNFPIEEELAGRLRSAGFSRVTWRRLTLGVAAIHIAVR